ncbi:hypothetical protein COV12_01565 [Candidatus Woesearchaeota archaeon CG10_big_fil_rev_8_21_14_0_10_32_24]|nr:MAG: hypothetical protein COV12_01565 [Candidatus Woesearchaeota archaeon CG10_big_fil_rev_8_21_14_0_10_32_24]
MLWNWPKHLNIIHVLHVNMVQITVREVNQDVFREFKGEAIKRGFKVGDALTFAMQKFNSECRSKYDLMSLKPFNLGKGNERVSEQVDEIMYGE